MVRLILNLMLAFSFLANGLANARGHLAHADQLACAHDSVVMDHAAMGHASHQDSMAMMHTSSDDKAPVKSGNCCGELVCKCGCALPTVVVAAAISVSPHATSSAPSVALGAHAVIRPNTAPFRPPSV